MKTIEILIGIALPMILLFGRNTSWIKSKAKWIIVFMLFIISVSYLFFNRDEFSAFFGMLLAPFAFSLIDMGVTLISMKKQGRDMYLWLRGSNDLAKNRPFQNSDIILSILLLFSALFLPLIGITIFR